ncbi:30S ribosomal protein S17 [Candidatus Zixiibacteriota bacterium]
MEEQVQAKAPQRNHRKTMVGRVVSNKMTKTVVILVERRRIHPFYGRVVKTSKKFMVHDEKAECQIGDIIKVMETRPLSKKKRWQVVEIQEKAK